MARHPMGDVIVLVPGILASVLELAPRPAGDYRVTVEGSDLSAQLVQPVSDVVMVVPADPDADG